MQAAGLVRRDGEQIRLARSTPETSSQTPTAESPRSDIPAGTTEAHPKARVLTAFSRETEGAVNFNVSVRVNMQEFFWGWHADRISAFFAGIAKVLAAKAGIEESEATE